MARTKLKQRKPQRRNPAAQAVRSRAYRPRLVPSKKTYSRKNRSSHADAENE
jgi:hypothetical protein